jgi:hypothetical protein
MPAVGSGAGLNMAARRGRFSESIRHNDPVADILPFSSGRMVMRIRQERQGNPVADEVLALTAVVRPILKGLLYALKSDIADELGGYEELKLKMLPRATRKSDGDCGVCFEYAVHDAVTRGDARVMERISDAARLCNLSAQSNPQSILFGLEKSGTQQLIDTAENILTADSRLLYGTRGQPVKLRKHLSGIAGAFRKPQAALALPYSIRGLWKADLFLGFTDEERWLGTSVKINSSLLEGARGLRIGIVPSRQGKSDAVRRDDDKNLIVCPLHHDQDFMQIFYEGWRVVQAFMAADAQIPKEVSLPSPVEREVARILAERREFGVLEVIEAIQPFGQPELLQTDERQVDLTALSGDPVVDMVVAPMPRNV